MFSGKTEQEIREIEDNLFAGTEISEDEKAVLVLKNFTRNFFIDLEKQTPMTREILKKIIQDDSYHNYIDKAIDDFYKEEDDYAEKMELNDVKLPDLDELDELFKEEKKR